MKLLFILLFFFLLNTHNGFSFIKTEHIIGYWKTEKNSFYINKQLEDHKNEPVFYRFNYNHEVEISSKDSVISEYNWEIQFLSTEGDRLALIDKETGKIFKYYYISVVVENELPVRIEFFRKRNNLNDKVVISRIFENDIDKALKHNDLYSIVFLHKNGIALNKKDSNNNTLLHKAIKASSDNICYYLINNGNLDLNQANNKGERCLFLALQTKRYSILKLLLQKNVDLSYKKQNGDNLLHIAVKTGDLRPVTYVTEKDKKLILEKNKLGETPLEVSVKKKFQKITNYFLSYKRKIESDRKVGKGSTKYKIPKTYRIQSDL